MRYAALLLGLALAGANAQVRTISGGGAGHHVEPHVTGNPRDPNELVVASMVVSDVDPTNWHVRAFWSSNGGAEWQVAALPPKDGSACSADVWLAWGRERNVYLICLAAVASPDGRDFNFRIWLHTSADAGHTWRSPVELRTQPLGEWDHPVVSLAPPRTGATRDTLFVAGTRPRRAGNAFAVARYAEGELEFGPVRVYEPPEQRNDNFGSAVAIDPDRVLLTYFAMPSQPPRPLFSLFVDDTSMRRTRVRDDVLPWGFPMLTRRAAADGSEQLIATWLERRTPESLDVMLGISADTGRTWSVSVPTSGAAARFRARPNVATDARGNLAVTWYEANGVTPCGEVVLTVRDADTNVFTERARVSTTEAACRVAADSPLVGVVNRWRAGGDYAGIHSPALGVFDVVWSDVRQDGFQVRFLRTRLSGEDGR
jgi:hypothetical protein